MQISARSVLMSGMAALTASAVAITPSVQPPPEPASAPTVLLAADVQPLVQQQPPLLTVLLNSPLGLLGPVATPGTVPPAPAPQAIAIAPNLANTIDNIYLAVEPWVRYGFEVATSIVRWIPVVGWAAGQIMIFYNFGESMVASGVFNFTDWLRGNGGAVENLVDFGIDVGLAFVWLGLDELNYFVPLPPIPLPPRPPLQGPFLASETLLGPVGAPEVGVTNAASDLVNAIYVPIRNGIDYGVNVLQAALAPIPVVRIAGDQVNLLWDFLAEPIANSVVFGAIDPILNAPLNINSYINGAINVGATTVNSLIATGFAEASYFLGIPLAASASTQSAEFKTSEVSSVPSLVKSTLGGSRNHVDTEGTVDGATDGPLAEVTKTVRDVRKEMRASFNERRPEKLSDTGDNGVVRAQGEVRGALAEAANDVVNAVRGGKQGTSADDAANAPTTVATSVRDSVKKVVKDVRQAVKDTRDAAKDRTGDDE